MNRWHRVLAVGLMFASLLAVALPGAWALPRSSRSPDLNRDGFGDLAIGVPYENVGGTTDSGAVQVLYGAGSALSSEGNQYWTQNTDGLYGVSEAFDLFGAALAIGDFDGDGYGDLAIGVPYEDVGSVGGAGAVNVIYGTRPGGLAIARNRYITQADDGMDGSAEENDHFGQALAVGDFDGDGYDDLAVGVPWEDVYSVVDAGAVHLLYGSANGLDASRDKAWHEDLLHSEAEAGDRCGSSLAAGDFDGDGYDDLAIGIPYENLVDIVDSGAVIVAWGSPGGLTTRVSNDFWHQDRSGIADGAEEWDTFGYSLAAADVNGDGYDDLAIGVPFEDLGDVVNAGVVHVLHGSDTGLAAPDEYWHQDSPGVGSLAEEGDLFGCALTFGDFDGDGFADLAVGLPYEDWDLTDTGIVQVLYGTSTGLTTPDQIWRQDISGVNGMEEEGDRFGWALAAADFDRDGRDDLAIGVPYEDVVVGGTSIQDAGTINLLYGSADGLAVAGDQLWYQGNYILGVPELGDRFGYALAAAAGPSSFPAYLPLIQRND
jgi:hypothetical protein